MSKFGRSHKAMQPLPISQILLMSNFSKFNKILYEFYYSFDESDGYLYQLIVLNLFHSLKNIQIQDLYAYIAFFTTKLSTRLFIKIFY